MATIYEVAARSGVSPATVSRVFNNAAVSPAKTRLVRKAATELGYTPNRTARSLRKKRSDVLALIIPDIANPFFTEIARGVEDVAQQAGYSLVLCDSDEDHKKESRYIDIAISENMAGIILAPAGDQCDLSQLITQRRPVVAIDRSPGEFNVDLVTVDNRAGGRAATQALIRQGYQRVACITGPSEVETAQLRAEGWRETVTSETRLAEPSSYLRHADYRVTGGRTAMQSLLSMPNPPDAVFIANNLMCVGALEELALRPAPIQNIGLATFGEIPYAELIPAPIITIRIPVRHLGTTAAAMLLERINGDTQPARTIVLRSESAKLYGGRNVI